MVSELLALVQFSEHFLHYFKRLFPLSFEGEYIVGLDVGKAPLVDNFLLDLFNFEGQNDVFEEP